MPNYTVRVALCGHFEDVDIEADTPDEACWKAKDSARDGDIIPCNPFEASCKDAYIDSVSDDDGEYDVPLGCMDWADQQIATLEAEIIRLKHKCGELS